MLSVPQLDSLNKPYHIFTDYVEHEALKQFISVMSRDDTVKGALMPDVHAGYTLPIGGVVLSKDRVYPEYVGVDIGCGMVSVKLEDGKTQTEVCQFDPVKTASVIRGVVPVGFESHSTPVLCFNLPKVPDSIADLVTAAAVQMGTLGGGNHFIEIGRSNSTGDLWLTLHSGSRGLGHKVATKYMKLSGGEGFQKGTPLYTEYKEAMNFVIAWAYYNRLTMISRIREALGLETGDMVACVHNFATETEEGVIHYKGANNLPAGVKGIIPANMRDGVYVVKGKGSEDAMDAVSHGAGRIMSRGEAKRQFSLEAFQEAMRMGVGTPTAFAVDTAHIDECPMAYKPIDVVMENQKSLCNVVDVIRPILNVKG